MGFGLGWVLFITLIGFCGNYLNKLIFKFIIFNLNHEDDIFITGFFKKKKIKCILIVTMEERKVEYVTSLLEILRNVI